MKFRTEYKAHRSSLTISADDRLLFLGSCFAGNIGGALRKRGMDVTINPCGVVYNPISLLMLIELARTPMSAEQLISESMTQRDGEWVSWFTDGSFADADRDKAERKVLKAFLTLHESMKTCKAVFVTLGTAFVYWHLGEPRIAVGNCHKHPAREFSRRMLSVEECNTVIHNLATKIKEINPDIEIVYTVSPVRHLADGFIDNNVSKSTLLLGVNRQRENGEALYFPAYEILNDDLRDYRFYASDLCHPSEEAVKYIEEKFIATFFDTEGIAVLDKAEEIRRRLNHRPLHPDTEAARKFAEDTDRMLAAFKAEHPGFSFDISF